MKKNNLFSMILGIIICVVLISGGTYAWRTFSASAENTTKTFTSRNFTFTSATGTSVTKLYPFPHQPIRAGITSGNGYIVLSLSKGAETPIASSVKIMVKFSTMQVNVADYIKVAVCKSTTASNCNNSATTAIPSSTNSSWLVVNKSLSNNTSEQLIYDDTSSTFKVVGSASATYYIYFWLNSEVVTNENAAQLAQSQVIGDVYFFATQGT